MTALFAGLAAFTTFKSAIPNLVPFYADPAIVALESSLLGSDPWRLLHDALGPRLGSFLLYSYHLPWFAWWTGLYVVVAWLKPSVLRSQYLLSFFLVLVLIGVVAATFGASVGPIFFDRIYGGERFGDLSRALQSVRFGDSVVRYADYLYSLHTEGRAGLGGGISALPSMHCAAVTLNALYMSQVHRLAGTLAWLFAACIYVGSVYTGWHYVVDGLVSLVGVTLIWKGTGSYLRTPQTRTESQLRA
ncbi:phosphatase PAP2 family protein [Parvularcula dongshanensis]|uniref:phosphatase PAP2 family protein n=1 Tax=Parvularcula dongshanensis TaxID=1173995 RepID=UPI00161D664B